MAKPAFASTLIKYQPFNSMESEFSKSIKTATAEKKIEELTNQVELLNEKLKLRPFREIWVELLGSKMTPRACCMLLSASLNDMITLVDDVIEHPTSEENGRIGRAKQLLESIKIR